MGWEREIFVNNFEGVISKINYVGRHKKCWVGLTILHSVFILNAINI